MPGKALTQRSGATRQDYLRGFPWLVDEDEQRLRGDRGVVGIALLVAAVLSVGVLTVRPDPRPMIRNAPIWMKDLFQTGENLVSGASPT